jgi:AraC-like DNA-binding protein
MRLSARTLQRRLTAEQTSFDHIVDEVRADLAVSYLRDSKLTVAAVAEILQFSETSALSRAFRRWYGLAPAQIRRRPGPDGVTGEPRKFY